MLFLDFCVSILYYRTSLDLAFCFMKYLFRFGNSLLKSSIELFYLACNIFLAPYFCLNGFNILVFIICSFYQYPSFFFYLYPLNIHILYSFWYLEYEIDERDFNFLLATLNFIWDVYFPFFFFFFNLTVILGSLKFICGDSVKIVWNICFCWLFGADIWNWTFSLEFFSDLGS